MGIARGIVAVMGIASLVFIAIVATQFLWPAVQSARAHARVKTPCRMSYKR
jgi:hypothetical protein